MPKSPNERIALMGHVLAAILKRQYRYNLSKGFFKWTQLPPPLGTQINCKAAAYLAKRLAEEKWGLEGACLKVVGFAAKDGFIVPAATGMKALGTTAPEIRTPVLACWEFSNHYRVQDPKGYNKIYDPVFGTSGNFNPTGILASSPSEVDVKAGVQITEYGEKYRVIRSLSAATKVEVLKQGPVAKKYIVDDALFK